MNARAGPCIAAALARGVLDGAPAAQIANEVAEAWRCVEASLTPIIGAAGVAALYRRSLLLVGRSHPWLTALSIDGQVGAHAEALAAALATQTSNDAALGGGALLETFYGLLSSVIGPSLTRTLLHFLWQPFEESAHGHRHD